jgi:tRNA(fMet)-specific endonuclease VapC
VSDYLLDTNIVSALVRHPQGTVAARIGQVGEAAVATSIIVAAELHFGAAKRQSERLSRQLAAVLAVLPVLPLSGDADRTYGELRARLEAAGRPIGGNDMLIAAHALTIGATLVTDNVGEFERVAGLRIENWLR